MSKIIRILVLIRPVLAVQAYHWTPCGPGYGVPVLIYTKGLKQKNLDQYNCQTLNRYIQSK